MPFNLILKGKSSDQNTSLDYDLLIQSMVTNLQKKRQTVMCNGLHFEMHTNININVNAQRSTKCEMEAYCRF